MNGGTRKYLAIEIGGTKLQLFAGDERANIVQRWRYDVNSKRGAEGIRGQIELALPEILRTHEIAAVGVGYGGPVDWRTGHICCSHQVPGWTDFPLGDWLRERAQRPVFIDNDANCGALGEAMRGAAQGKSPVFFLTLGSGVGGGCVAGGKIYHGAKPGEGEIGHVRLDRNGTIVEQRCSGWAMDKKIRAVVKEHPNSQLAQATHGMERGEARALSAAADCPFTKQVLREWGEDLAFGLSHVTHLMHPEVIVLGGGLALVGEPLRAAVESVLPRFVMEAFAPGPRVALSALREDAIPVGALLLAASGLDQSR